jgi:hypothetical protein
VDHLGEIKIVGFSGKKSVRLILSGFLIFRSYVFSLAARINFPYATRTFKRTYMDLISTLGLAAACFTTSAFVPQAYKTIKTKSTKGLSAGTIKPEPD